MKNKKIMYIFGISLITIFFLTLVHSFNKQDTEIQELEATILSIEETKLTIQDSNNIIYTFNTENINEEVGTNILIKYSGLLDKNKEIQDSRIVSYITSPVSTNGNGIPTEWMDNGIFKNFYTLAYNKLKKLSLDEKIGQLFLVRYPENNILTDLNNYKFSGYVFFEKDFKNKSEKEVKNMINTLQNKSKIPLLTAVDEEGGKVVRVSSNPNLVSEPFKSSKELYSLGGFTQITQDTKEKSKVLKNLGLNLNLAPVVDISTTSNDYIYERSFGKDAKLTSTYAKTVIESSKNTGVSYTLKHFPGYGNNTDTHLGTSIDKRTYEDIIGNDILPFKEGIDVGAEAVLVSHNIINSIDPDNPASLSKAIHNLLRNELNFTGIIITDDLAMASVSSIEDVTVKALLAGNDLIITTDYASAINSVKDALKDGTISENLIDKLAFRILSWKYYKKLITENQK